MSDERQTSEQSENNSSNKLPIKGFSGPDLLKIVADMHSEVESQPGGFEKFRRDLEAFENQLAKEEAADIVAERQREQELFPK